MSYHCTTSVTNRQVIKPMNIITNAYIKNVTLELPFERFLISQINRVARLKAYWAVGFLYIPFNIHHNKEELEQLFPHGEISPPALVPFTISAADRLNYKQHSCSEQTERYRYLKGKEKHRCALLIVIKSLRRQICI